MKIVTKLYFNCYGQVYRLNLKGDRNTSVNTFSVGNQRNNQDIQPKLQCISLQAEPKYFIL